MRDILTGLAVVLILCLTGALVAPHLIDWDSRREIIAKHLSAHIGERVRLDGPIGLELLPSPSLKLSMVNVGDTGPIRMTIGRIKLHMAIPPLLRGEVRITEAVVHTPHITLQPKRLAVQDTSPRRNAAGPSAFVPAALPSIGVDRLSIVDGAIDLLDASGSSGFPVRRIDGSLEVTALTGPFRGTLQFETGDEKNGMQRRNLRFATGQIGNNGLRVKALAENETLAARSEFDGEIAVSDGQLSLNGQVSGSGNAAVPLGDGFAQVIWRAGGRLAFLGGAGRLDTVDLSIGNGDRQITLTGNAELAVGSALSIKAKMAGKQADLDRLMANDNGKRSFAPVSLLPHAALKGSSTVLPAWLQGELELSLASVLLGGDVITAPRVAVAFTGPDTLKLMSAEAQLPGETKVQLNSVETANNTQDAARLHVSSRDVARLNGWFNGRPARQQAFRQLTLDGDLRISGDGLSLQNTRILADDMILGGSMRLDHLPGGSKLTLNLLADQLDIARLPDLGEGDNRAGIDLDVTLEAQRVRYLGVGAGRIAARFLRTGSDLVVEKFDMADVGGATLAASGSFAPDRQDFKLTLEARQLDAVSELADKLLPQNYASQLRQRAPYLVPARINVAADTRLENGLRQQTVHVAGTLADTLLEAQLRLQPDGQLAGSDGVAADISTPHVARLMRQVGFETIPLAQAGGARLRLRGNGLVAGKASADWTLSGTLGNLGIDFKGNQTRDPGQPFDGVLSLQSSDLAPLAQTLLVTVPAIPVGMPFELKAGVDLRGYRITLRDVAMNAGGTMVKGEIAFNLAEFGRVSGQLRTGSLEAASLAPLIFGTAQQPLPSEMWSRERFAPAAAMTLPGDLWIEADRVGVVGNLTLDKPTFVVRFENGIIYLEHVAAHWNGNPLTGQATLRRNGPTVNLTGRIALEQMQIGQLPGSGITGDGSGHLAFSAIGDSPAGVVGALAGAGRIDIRQAEVRSLEPGALDTIITQQQTMPAAVTHQQLAATLRDRVTGRVGVPPVQLPLNLAGGVLRAGPLAILNQDADIRGTLSFDLRSLSVMGEMDHIMRQAPRGWAGPNPRARLTWTGPLRQVQPSIDTTALANGLTAIAIQRETERIEVLEQDQQERMMFNRRLKASEDERKAQEAARRAALEEQRRLAAARAELARQETLKQEALKQEALRQRVDDVNRVAPPSGTGTVNQPLIITPPAARP